MSGDAATTSHHLYLADEQTEERVFGGLMRLILEEMQIQNQSLLPSLHIPG